jgi:hypothetical protein
MTGHDPGHELAHAIHAVFDSRIVLVSTYDARALLSKNSDHFIIAYPRIVSSVPGIIDQAGYPNPA